MLAHHVLYRGGICVYTHTSRYQSFVTRIGNDSGIMQRAILFLIIPLLVITAEVILLE